MSNAEDLSKLRREVRALRFTVVGMVAAVGGMLLMGATSEQDHARFKTISAERINIVEPDGLYRAVLTSSARTPGPMKQARDGAPEGTRNFPFAGLIIYGPEGEEQGGYGTGSSPQGSITVRSIDWDEGRGEAVATFRRVGADG